MIRNARTEPLLATADISMTKAFYEQLGFKTLNTWEPDGQLRWCLVEYEGASLMLQQETDESKRAGIRGQPRDYGIYFVCEGDIDELRAALVAKGVKVSAARTEFYGMRQIFLTDPDGRSVCFEAMLDGFSAD